MMLFLPAGLLLINFSFPLYDTVGVPLLVGWFLLLFILERLFPLRSRVQPFLKRAFANAAVASVSMLLLRLALLPVMVWLAHRNLEWRIGLSYLVEMPAAVWFALGLLLLDYSNYLWHVLNHRVGLLWRFHQVHHTDLDLDVTTAIRFHFGEIVASVVFRGAAVLLIGASPVLVLVYEIVFEAATNFHHSNWRLPVRLDKALNWVVVTPRMHGIHHSIIRHETDSNFSVIFSWWDRLHTTFLQQIPQQEITIGTPYLRSPKQLAVLRLLKLPFGPMRAWKLPDGSVPTRTEDQER